MKSSYLLLLAFAAPLATNAYGADAGLAVCCVSFRGAFLLSFAKPALWM